MFRNDIFSGKIALITGGGTGIGYALAHALAAHGASLAIASRNPEHLQVAERELQKHGTPVLTTTVNIKDPDSVEAMTNTVYERFSRVDFLINNAGANFLAPATGISPNGWKSVVDVVLNGTYHVTRSVGLRMLAGGGGRILMMAATNAHAGSPLMAHSGAAKAGIISLAETLAVEWAPTITVNSVSPGPVRTHGADSRLWPDEASQKRLAESIPLGRIAEAEDVVGACMFLLSDSASFITGANLEIDGGQRLRNWLKAM